MCHNKVFQPELRQANTCSFVDDGSIAESIVFDLLNLSNIYFIETNCIFYKTLIETNYRNTAFIQ